MGRNCGKRKLELKPTYKERCTYFKKRKMSVEKAAKELSTLCGVDIAMVLFSPDGGATATAWSCQQAFPGLIDSFFAEGSGPSKKTYTVSEILEEESGEEGDRAGLVATIGAAASGESSSGAGLGALVDDGEDRGETGTSVGERAVFVEECSFDPRAGLGAMVGDGDVCGETGTFDQTSFGERAVFQEECSFDPRAGLGAVVGDGVMRGETGTFDQMSFGERAVFQEECSFDPRAGLGAVVGDGDMRGETGTFDQTSFGERAVFQEECSFDPRAGLGAVVGDGDMRGETWTCEQLLAATADFETTAEFECFSDRSSFCAEPFSSDDFVPNEYLDLDSFFSSSEIGF